MSIAQAPAAVLGLFPYFGPDAIGGAQLSGRLGWEGLRAVASGDLFCYGPGLAGATLPGGVVATSRGAALRLALTPRRRPTAVLIWHLSLLRLLPLFRVGRARVSVMLLGIEAWRHHDPLTRLMLGRVDQFLSISDHTWRRFLDFYPDLAHRPHRTVYLGLGEPAAGPPPPPADPPTALIVGRLARGEEYKGHHELIAAWPGVRKRIPSAQLWVAGDGDLRPDLEAETYAHGVADSVRFWGLVSEERKAELIAASRCLAMPSRGEGFGLVYLEAMRLGRPCLVSSCDAGREVVAPPEAGLAANPSDPAALADALCRLLTDGPEWAAWSAQARSRYERQFTARHFQARLNAAVLSSQDGA